MKMGVLYFYYFYADYNNTHFANNQMHSASQNSPRAKWAIRGKGGGSSQDIKDQPGEAGSWPGGRHLLPCHASQAALATCRVKVSIACYIIHTSLMATCLTSSCYCRQGHFSVFSLARRINISRTLYLSLLLSLSLSFSLSPVKLEKTNRGADCVSY